MRPAWVSPLVLSLVAAFAVGCTSPVAAGLDEEDANRVVVALGHANIDAEKEADPAVEGKFRVLVARDDASQALSTLGDEELPRPRPPGLLEATGKGALVPSAAAEHAQYVAGISGELERSLGGIDGVLSARVHLNVPAPDPLRDGPAPKATASVLLAYRGSTQPITTESVQRLVAGGVSSLAPADVAVIAVSRPAPAQGGSSQLAHIGPLAVARGSVRPLQLALAGLIVVVAALAAALLAAYARVARLRQELDAQEPARGGRPAA